MSERSMRIARGRWQEVLLADLLRGFAIPARADAMLRGKARNWNGRYQRSLDSLLLRLQDAGFTLVRQPGPRGGVGTIAVVRG